MNKKIIIAILVLIILGGIVFFITKLSFRRPSSYLETPQIKVSPIELEKEYIKEVSKIMSLYFEGRKSIDLVGLKGEALKAEENKWLDLISKTRNDLLELRVPALYKDLHLNLVISLNLLEQEVGKDEQKLKEYEEKLNKVIENYSWLR